MNTSDEQGSKPTAPSVISPLSSSMGPAKVRHEWFQNEYFVTITIFIKNINSEAVNINFTEKTLSVTIKLPTAGTDYSLELDPLAHDIVPSESSYSVLGTKIEIKCKKAVMGLKWGTLESDDAITTQTLDKPSPVGAFETKPTYPSSSKKKHDWDKLIKEVESEKPAGEGALNSLFQRLYRDADDDTRRAMIKSYTESNGTALSTNWSEVGRGRVEISPPEGMEAKRYDL